MAYQPVKLIYNSYQPSQLEVGMMFAVNVNINDYSYLHLRKLEKLPRDIEEYLQHNGLPVKPYFIRSIDSNPDVPPEVVAYPDQIAYYEQEGQLFDFTIDDMNYINLEDEGYIALYFDDETNQPVLEDGKVVVTAMDNMWNPEDEDWVEHELDESDWDWEEEQL
jgi:hypothetical protein